MGHDLEVDYVHISHRKAKVHRGRKCTRCGKTMPPGTLFTIDTYLVDGDFRHEVGCVLLGDDYECPLTLPRTGSGSSNQADAPTGARETR